MASPSGQSYLDKINTYYEHYPDWSKFIDQSTNTPQSTTLEKGVKDLQVNELSREEALRREFLYIGGPEVIHNSQKKEQAQAKDKEDASSSR